MVPWPIAVVCGLYAVIATSAAAAVWRAPSGEGVAAIGWSWFWLAMALGIVAGLAFMKPWGRRLAVWGSVALLVSTMGSAVLAVMQAHPQPLRSMTATGLAGVYLVVIRYLTRPRVKAWFIE